MNLVLGEKICQQYTVKIADLIKYALFNFGLYTFSYVKYECVLYTSLNIHFFSKVLYMHSL